MGESDVTGGNYKEIDINAADLSIKERVNIVCLYFARLKSDEPAYKEYRKVLVNLSRRYNIKFNTIKNNKDRYDANFDNGRMGWHQTPLENQNKFMYEIFLKYKDMPLETLEKIIEDIMLEAEQEGKPFYSIKTKHPVSVESILRKESNIEIDGLNVLRDTLSLGQLFFVVLGGDKNQAWVTWETGLIGMGVITKLPYDVGYEKNNYRIKIDMKVLLKHPIKREQLVPYHDTYDIIGIGPITKWEPNQAISQIPENKAVALMRAMLDLCPDIDEDLSNTVDEQLMARIKGSAVMLVPQELEYGEIQEEELYDDPEDDSAAVDDFYDVYEPEIRLILEDFVMPEAPIISLKNFINSQKHIILIGPPGTGKTALAERACEEAVRTNYISGYTITTAVSDWSTFDTIGGYMPNKNGELMFEEGIFLKSIRENKWLLIDEINRAEIDKAFGHFFTVLSGRDVELQYKADVLGGNKHISICNTNTRKSYYDIKTATYFIGKNWRIVATMNTYDKNSLFMLSYAFMRRFAFVYIPTPHEDDFNQLITKKLDGNDALSKIIIELTKISPKKLGVALILDLISYLEKADYNGLAEGISSLIIPQYEGLTLQQIKQLYKDLCKLLQPADRAFLQNYLCEFYDINPSDLKKLTIETYDDESEEDLLPDA